MRESIDRREFLKLAGLGGAVFASGLAGGAKFAGAAEGDFYFVQLSDTHWGFNGPVVNPDAGGTLPKAVAAVNSLGYEPDFIVFTGDLTHTTDDPKERRRRLAEFRDIVKNLKNKNVRFMPGEHDAALDNGQAWKEFFGASYYSFDHKGVHFIAIDNVSDPAARIGGEQLAWLKSDLATQAADARIVVFTGDLTHTTDDPKERRRRLAEFRDIVGALKNKNVRFMPGEHDASLDNGQAWKEFFGPSYYSFDHKGVHFVAIDNVSDASARIGEAQLAWLKADLAKQDKDARIVVFTHRPLFDLAPQWDWATRDGAQAIDLLMPYRNVTVFYGHIHQEHHQMTGHIAHHSAKSLIFPLPAPGSQPKRVPIAWDPAQPYKGLGFRGIETELGKAEYEITEFPVVKA